MRYLDADEAAELNAEAWQINLLTTNPSYCSWGPHEDYMWKEGSGWDSRVIIPSWKEFGWELNDLNECANFYFEINRPSVECESCGGNGYHPEAQQVVRSFYQHSCLPGEWAWNAAITEDEALALILDGRAKEGDTAESINAQNRPGARSFGHDAINRHILIDARLTRLELPKTCPSCEGKGYVYTSERALVSLVLWWLHPRKGCSRGVEIGGIAEADLPDIRSFLKSAADRNAERFAGVDLIAARNGEPRHD
jgi:hypothetical protein